MQLKNNEIIITKRADGSLVGREVSRQRRWQIRNVEKSTEIQKRYIQSEKGKESRRRYEKLYRKKNKDEKNLIIDGHQHSKSFLKKLKESASVIFKLGTFISTPFLKRNRKKSSK